MAQYPFVRQNDQSDCGAATLAMLTLYHGLPMGLEQMRELTGTDRVGTHLLALLEAAERIGFSAKGVQGDYDGLFEAPLPAIAHTHNADGLGHFIVLYNAGPKRVVVADPAHEGVEALSREEFCSRWSGYLLLLTPEQPLSRPDGTGAPAGAWCRFLGLLRGHVPVLAEAFACALLMTLLTVTTSYFIQHLVDSVLVRHETRLLNALGVGMVTIVVMRGLFGVFRQYLLAYVGRKVDLGLVARYSRHVLGLPMQFFETRQVGEILSRMYDADKVRNAISGTTLTVVVDATLVVVSLGILWYYDWRLALVATLFAPLLVLSVVLHHPVARRKSREAMEHTARFSSHLVEDVSGVETIKAFGAERRRLEGGESRLVRLVQTSFSLQKLGISMETLGQIVTGAAGIVILWYGGHRVMAGALTIGELMFFYSMLNHLLGPLHRLSSVNLEIQDASVALDRLHQVLDLKPESTGRARKAEFTGVAGQISLQNVSFRYGCREDVLHDVSLSIPAGHTVAVVGESGSGKSTLLKLLMGFYMPAEGRVQVDGVDIQDMDLTSLRSRIGLVSQEPFVFSGTLADNIALGRPDAPLSEIIEAARSAGLDDFVAALPDRYETVIGERGANLSGGQRQRLAIARALLCRPDVLLFDEATSHLDTASERAIQEGLQSALSGQTAVLVAHRLSTIRHADLIYVLHEGRVVEQGTHEQLMRRDGRYAALWKASDHAPSAETKPEPTATATNGNGKLRKTHYAY